MHVARPTSISTTSFKKEKTCWTTNSSKRASYADSQENAGIRRWAGSEVGMRFAGARLAWTRVPIGHSQPQSSESTEVGGARTSGCAQPPLISQRTKILCFTRPHIASASLQFRDCPCGWCTIAPSPVAGLSGLMPVNQPLCTHHSPL